MVWRAVCQDDWRRKNARSIERLFRPRRRSQWRGLAAHQKLHRPRGRVRAPGRERRHRSRRGSRRRAPGDRVSPNQGRQTLQSRHTVVLRTPGRNRPAQGSDCDREALRPWAWPPGAEPSLFNQPCPRCSAGQRRWRCLTGTVTDEPIQYIDLPVQFGDLKLRLQVDPIVELGPRSVDG